MHREKKVAVSVCSVFLLCLLGLPAGCSLFHDTPSEPQPAPGMSVTVNLLDEHRCSRLSPEILVTGAPQGTDSFDVRLMETTASGDERFWGGGTWQNDGSGVIPEGALARQYRGPCPSAGQTGNYAFVVSAMRRGDIQPLAVRIYRFTQE